VTLRRALVIALAVIVVLAALGGAVVLRTRPHAKVELTDPGPTGQRIAEAGVFANYFPARGKRSGPGLLLLGGSEGGLSEAMRQPALELQTAGFSVLTPSYFGAPDEPKRLERVPLETFDRALRWLRARSEVDPARVGIGGISKGAEAALVVATRHPEIRAVVVGAPSSVIWPGIRWGKLKADSSWTLAGRPLPFLPYGPFKLRVLFGDIGALYREGVERLGQHQDAVIPVEKITAPILVVCGEQDTLWPSCPMARQIKERGGPRVRILAYDNAGHHCIGPPLQKNSKFFSELGRVGGSNDGNNRARADGWPKILGFVDSALGARR